MNCLYILESKLLLVMLFTNIFSQSMGCLFFFFSLCMFSFAVQKLASLISSFNFCFYIYCLGRMALENIGKIYIRECFAYVLF